MLTLTFSNAAVFFMVNSFPYVSRVVHHSKDIKPTSQKFGKHCSTTWAIIPMKRFIHLVEYMPKRIEAVLRAKEGAATQYYKCDLNVLYTQCILKCQRQC